MSDALPSIVDSDFRQVAVGGSARLPARYRGRGPAAGPTLLSRSISRHLRIGIVAVLLVVVGIGGWATLTDLASAVVAGGTMVVDSSSKKVQHPIGGIVAELLVHDGDSVKAGDVLVRLDATQTRAVAAMVSKDLIEMLAQQARLEAERDD